MDNEQYWLDQFGMPRDKRDNKYADLKDVPHHLRTLKVCKSALYSCPFNLIHVPVHLRNDEIVQIALDDLIHVPYYFRDNDTVQRALDAIEAVVS
jgi:hypothetical protein